MSKGVLLLKYPLGVRAILLEYPGKDTVVVVCVCVCVWIPTDSGV